MTPPANTQTAPALRPLTARHIEMLQSRLELDLAEVHDLEGKLRAEVLSALESRRDIRTDDSGDPENATLAFEGAQISAMLAQTSRHAAEISAAITRIENGTFGICLNCGDRISTGRLDARPASAYCIVCAS